MIEYINMQLQLIQILTGSVFAFLVGSIPFGYVIGRWRGIDIRQHGSGNIGATNVGRVLGKKWGYAVFGLDFLKGIGAVWGGKQGGHILFGSESLPSYAPILFGIAAVLGHNFCPWLGWKGGKGIATSAGILAIVFPTAFFCALGIWILVFLIARYVSLASIAAAITLIGSGFYFYQWSFNSLACLVLGLLAIARHHSNIKRLLTGTEPKTF